MELTVAICTYQRHDLLRTTLESLAQCEPIAARWEVVVIDNEASDVVKGVVESFGREGLSRDGVGREMMDDRREAASGWGRMTIRYVAEPVTGTSHARNRAVREAAAPIVLFTDDDVTFDRGWLARMWGQIQAQPQCAFWGGRVLPVWTMPKPAWFDERQCALLGDTIVQYDRGDTSRAWSSANDPPFYTANLALRKEAILAAGGFDTTVGHRGAVRMGMEDSLMVRAISKAGGEGWYVADAIVHHPVPADRMERGYARQFAWRQGWLSAELTRRGGDLSGPRGKMPRWFFRAAATQWCKGMTRMISGAFTFNTAKRFGGRVMMSFGASKLWHAMKG